MLMKKLQRFDCLTHLEPVNLEKRIALSDLKEESSSISLSQSSGLTSEAIIQEKEDEAEKNALKLLEAVKSSVPSTSLKQRTEKLLLDFFKERLIGLYEQKTMATCGVEAFTDELLRVARDWMNGRTCDLFLGWEVQENRRAYVEDMEKGGMWKKVDNEENKEIATEVEAEVFGSLVDELLNDLIPS